MQFHPLIDEASLERQVEMLIELGFQEKKAKKAVHRFQHTVSLEDLVEKALMVSEDEDSKYDNQRISLIQFSEIDSIGHPMVVESPCAVCLSNAHEWIKFECNHQFCGTCVIKYIQQTRAKEIDSVTCLQNGCHMGVKPQHFERLEKELCKQDPGLNQQNPLCRKCKVPLGLHKFGLFQNACESAELSMLTDCVRQDNLGNILQRCPNCSIWVQKSQGCNYVTCSYCKSNWCWLCRSTCGPDHFTMLNPLGCPGLGEERHTLNEWPWHKICLRKVKALLLFFLLYLLCVLIYPFYVAYIVIRRMEISLEGPLWQRAIKAIGIALLFLLLCALAVFPGILIFISSKQARVFVFGR